MSDKLGNILGAPAIVALRQALYAAHERVSEEWRILAGYNRHEQRQYKAHPERGHGDLSQQESDLADAGRAVRAANLAYTQAVNAACAAAGLPPYIVVTDVPNQPYNTPKKD